MTKTYYSHFIRETQITLILNAQCKSLKKRNNRNLKLHLKRIQNDFLAYGKTSNLKITKTLTLSNEKAKSFALWVNKQS